MSNSRITLALSSGKMIVTNNENVSVGLIIFPDGADNYIKVIGPGQTLNITRLCSVKCIRSNKKLLETLSRRRFKIHDTWSST